MTQATPVLSRRQDATAIKDEWGRGAEPDARAALARRPDLAADKSVVLELAYEEYCVRWEKGQRPDPDVFCDRFPTYRQSLRGLVAAHQFLGDRIHVLTDKIHVLTEARPVRWPQAGEQLGDFLLLRELGRGAFARVYLALEESMGGRPVAVKLSPEGGAEARTLGRLAHPNVVPVLSVRYEESTGLMAVCMPFLGVATLTDVFDAAYPDAQAPPPRTAKVIRQATRAAARADDPPPLAAAPEKPDDGLYTDAVARLAGQMADALALLHKEGICHRDLKPSNVLVSPAGQALLLDFNLAADARFAAPRLGGTLPYMAPEQLQALIRPRDEAALDKRMDLFALGVILYELLTGKLPYGPPPQGQSPEAAAAVLLDRQRTGRVPLRTLNPAVDRRLAVLIERCLGFDPAGRPTAAALAADFRKYLTPPARLRRAAARRPWAVALAAGVLLLALGGAARQLAAPAHANSHDGSAMEKRSAADSYRRGREAFRAGDYVRAEELFGRAIADSDEKPKPRNYYRAHAAAVLQQADANFSVALADLDKVAVEHQADGATMALLGYCSSRIKRHDDAIQWYDQAIQAGFTSAALLNDRGLSCLQSGRLPEARTDFDAALAIDPDLQPARINRAVLCLRQRSTVPPPPVPPTVLAGLESTLETEPGSQELYFTAASLFAAAAQDGGADDPKGYAKQALFYVRKAVACGLEPNQIRDDPILSAALQADPAFQAALAAPALSIGPKSAQRLVNPAPSLPE